MRECHAGLILFREHLNNRMAGPPNKLFNYMSAGLPVVTVDFPELHRIVTEEECGVLVGNQSADAIAEAIERLLADPQEMYRMGTRGQAAVRERYSWEVMNRRLISAYERLADQFPAISDSTTESECEIAARRG